MGKVKCEDCRHWSDSGRKTKRRRAMFSLSYNYVSVGSCMSDKCAEETLGYTGIASGHKMTRYGEILRYCKHYKPKGIDSFQCTCCGRTIDGKPAKIIRNGRWRVLHGPKSYIFEASERFSAYLCEPCTAHWEKVNELEKDTKMRLTKFGETKILLITIKNGITNVFFDGKWIGTEVDENNHIKIREE